MPVTVQLPAALKRFVDNRNAIELPGQTAGDVLQKLALQFPELAGHLYDERGRLRNFLNFYLNDEDIRHFSHESTPVKDGDTLQIVAAVAGG